jgi:hypothetical protein
LVCAPVMTRVYTAWSCYGAGCSQNVFVLRNTVSGGTERSGRADSLVARQLIFCWHFCYNGDQQGLWQTPLCYGSRRWPPSGALFYPLRTKSEVRMVNYGACSSRFIVHSSPLHHSSFTVRRSKEEPALIQTLRSYRLPVVVSRSDSPVPRSRLTDDCLRV